MAIDPKLIDDLNSRRKKVILSGGQEKITLSHANGGGLKYIFGTA